MGRTLLSVSYTKTFNFAKMLVQLQNHKNVEQVENQNNNEEIQDKL